jgi:hypothetical protein
LTLNRQTSRDTASPIPGRSIVRDLDAAADGTGAIAAGRLSAGIARPSWPPSPGPSAPDVPDHRGRAGEGIGEAATYERGVEAEMTCDLEGGLHMRIKQLPERMTFAEWLADARDAGKCGEAGIPVVGDVPPTPTAMLRRRTQVQTRAMEAQLVNLKERIGQLQAKLDELGLQEAEILGRPVYRLPAEANVPDEVVADRRAADNRKEAAPIRQQIAVLVRQRDELAAKAAEIDHDIVMRWRQARSIARAVGELARRREARYWRLLCHRHTEGARLAALFDHPRIVLAAWVNGPADERSL